MTTATEKKQPTKLERQTSQLEKLTDEGSAIEVENARLRDKERMALEERARTSPGTLSQLFRVGGEAAEIQKKLKKNASRLENIRAEAAALGVAIQESQAQRVEDRTAEFRARQLEIHKRELAALDSVFESFNALMHKFHDDYAPVVAEAHQLFGEARSEGLVSSANEQSWRNIAKPAITPPGDFEIFLANSLAAAFRGGNAVVARIYTEKVERRSGLGVPNPYKPRAESS